MNVCFVWEFRDINQSIALVDIHHKHHISIPLWPTMSEAHKAQIG